MTVRGHEPASEALLGLATPPCLPGSECDFLLISRRHPVGL